MIKEITKIFLLSIIITFTLISCSTTDPDFDAEGDIKKGKIHLISYGFSTPLPPPNENYNRQIDSLKKVYGVEYDNRGCILDSVLLRKADSYNKIVIAYLSKRNGQNWHENYQRQVDSLYKLIKPPQNSINQ